MNQLVTRNSALRNNKGFTVIELIIVIVILGVLAAVLIPKMMGREQAAKIQAAEMDMLRLYEACEAWKANFGKPNFTGLGEGVSKLVSDNLWPADKANPWNGTYTFSIVPSTGDNQLYINSGPLPDENSTAQLISRLQSKGYSPAQRDGGVEIIVP